MLWPAVAGSISDIYASGELRMLGDSFTTRPVYQIGSRIGPKLPFRCLCAIVYDLY